MSDIDCELVDSFVDAYWHGYADNSPAPLMMDAPRQKKSESYGSFYKRVIKFRLNACETNDQKSDVMRHYFQQAGFGVSVVGSSNINYQKRTPPQKILLGCKDALRNLCQSGSPQFENLRQALSLIRTGHQMLETQDRHGRDNVVQIVSNQSAPVPTV